MSAASTESNGTHAAAQVEPTTLPEMSDELRRVREERDALQAQYQGLLGKLTGMRNTLGERLRQDAVS